MSHQEDKSTSPQENETISQNDVANESQSAERHQGEEQPSNENKQKQNTCEPAEEKTWHNKNALKRGIAMLGYGFIAGFVRLGITIIAIFQFFSLLFAEKANQPLVKFGQNLNTFLYQINQFLTVNSEMYPFPFADWPESAPSE